MCFWLSYFLPKTFRSHHFFFQVCSTSTVPTSSCPHHLCSLVPFFFLASFNLQQKINDSYTLYILGTVTTWRNLSMGLKVLDSAVHYLYFSLTSMVQYSWVEWGKMAIQPLAQANKLHKRYNISFRSRELLSLVNKNDCIGFEVFLHNTMKVTPHVLNQYYC